MNRDFYPLALLRESFSADEETAELIHKTLRRSFKNEEFHVTCASSSMIRLRWSADAYTVGRVAEATSRFQMSFSELMVERLKNEDRSQFRGDCIYFDREISDSLLSGSANHAIQMAHMYLTHTPENNVEDWDALASTSLHDWASRHALLRFNNSRKTKTSS